MKGLGLVPSLLLLSALAGCREDLTQVVVVLQSDVAVPTEADGIQTMVGEGPFAPTQFDGRSFFGADFLRGGFPLSVGVTSAGNASNFSMNVQLFSKFGLQGSLIVVNRSITDVRFVEEKTMMVVVPLLRACACQGTACPSPGNPQCDAINQPPLLPFDPEVAPPSQSPNGPFQTGSPPLRQEDTGLSVAVAGGPSS